MSRAVHHIALGARDVEEVAAFYRQVFDLREVDRHVDEGGRLRSIWLDMNGPILMVERSDDKPRRVDGVGAGPFLIAMSVTPDERPDLEERLERFGAPIEERTDFTSYARDPEGNRVAISHYPQAASQS